MPKLIRRLTQRRAERRQALAERIYREQQDERDAKGPVTTGSSDAAASALSSFNSGSGGTG